MLTHYKGTYKRTGDQWCQNITTVLWAQWTLVWALRNAVIQGKDKITHRQCREQEDLRQLRELYSQRQLQDLLFDTVEEHEQLPVHSIHNWIAIHATLVQQSIKLVSTRAIQGGSAKHLHLFSTHKHIAYKRQPEFHIIGGTRGE